MDTPSFSYSLNASTIRTTPLLEQIRVAAQTGYRGIELWHDAIDHYLSEGGSLKTIKDLLDDSGLTVPTTIYLGDWFDAPESQWPQVLEECLRRMDQAAYLEAPHVIAGPPGGRADVELGAKRYRELLERGLSIGTSPSMEFLGFVEQVNRVEDAVEILKKCDHPNGTTVLDPFHIFRGGGQIESISQLQASQIAVAHFNDTPPFPERELQHDHHRVMPGEGHLDLKGYLTRLQGIGYASWLSLELFNEQLWLRDPKEVALVGLETMRAIAEG